MKIESSEKLQCFGVPEWDPGELGFWELGRMYEFKAYDS